MNLEIDCLQHQSKQVGVVQVDGQRQVNLQVGHERHAVLHPASGKLATEGDHTWFTREVKVAEQNQRIHEKKKGNPHQPSGWERRFRLLSVRMPHMVPWPPCWAGRPVIRDETACFAVVLGTRTGICHQTLSALGRGSIKRARHFCIRKGEQGISVIVRDTVEGLGGTVPLSVLSLQRVKRARQGKGGGELVHLVFKQEAWRASLMVSDEKSTSNVTTFNIEIAQ